MEPSLETPTTPSSLMSRKVIIAILGVAILAVVVFVYIHSSQEATPILPITTATSTPAPSPASLSALEFRPATVALSSGKSFSLNIPSHYSLDVSAEGFQHVRFMSWSPDHRLFIGEMTNASDAQTGRVIVLDGFDREKHTFANVHVYLDHLRNPNSVAFYRDTSGRDWIYIALTDKLIRYPYTAGDSAGAAAPQTLATFPDFGPTASQGGWHLTRTLAFSGNSLAVSVGSGCNSCEEPGVVRGDIIAMNPDGTGEHVIAGGLRNAVGIIYANGALYATANEADHLGNDKPNDLVYKISEGANYGWPYCYESDGVVYQDTSQMWATPYDCSRVPLAFAELEPHSAPLGLAFFDDGFADPVLRDSLLVAEHGSGKPSIGTGYMLRLVRQGTSTPFMTGFLQDGKRAGRPVDILQDDNASFFITDDLNGALYYMRYHG